MRLSNNQQFPNLEVVTRPNVDTAAAAYYLNRRPQTLRCWAIYEGGAYKTTQNFRKISLASQ